jgi:hypothetical protein
MLVFNNERVTYISYTNNRYKEEEFAVKESFDKFLPKHNLGSSFKKGIVKVYDGCKFVISFGEPYNTETKFDGIPDSGHIEEMISELSIGAKLEDMGL